MRMLSSQHFLLFFTILIFTIPNVISQDKILEEDLGDFKVTISNSKQVLAYDSPIILQFEVLNISDKDVRFCKRNSPLEGKFNFDFFVVTDEEGNKIEYIGESFERMPPTEIEFITLAAMTKMVYEIDVGKGYKFVKPGKYTVIFNGDDINKLPHSNPLVLELK